MLSGFDGVFEVGVFEEGVFESSRLDNSRYSWSLREATLEWRRP